MEKKSSARQSIPSSPTLDGLQPSVLSEEGLFLRMSCPVCANKYLLQKSKWAWNRARGTRVGLTCSKSCARKKYHAENPGASYFNRMPEEQRGNPSGTTRTPEQRAHLSRLAKARAHHPPYRGGNGTGMSPAERVVSQCLPPGWVWNYPVALGKRQPDFPTNYKLDFAHPTSRLGLEIDGSSHTAAARKAQDRKKEAKLASLGWSVYRLSNAEALRLFSTSKLTEHLTTLLKAR